MSAMVIERIPTGIPELDELIEGGFPTSSMVLLVGYPGAGKTTFSAQFIHNGATQHRARSVYVCFAETKETFLRNMGRFGWDFERLEREERVAILELSVTREAGLQKNLDHIMETMTSLEASRLVIDSFSAISMALKDSIDIRVMVHLLYRFLKKANCVSILIIDQPWGSSVIGEGISEFLADGIIHLETGFDHRGILRRRLKILKMRGTSHTRLPYEYDITSSGFVLLGPEEHVKPRSSRTAKRSEKRETRAKDEGSLSRAVSDLTGIKGIGPKRLQRLRALNINSVEDLAENKPLDVAERIGISRKVALRWIRAARRALPRG